MSKSFSSVGTGFVKNTTSPLLLVVGAAVLWSTGGLFIKAISLPALQLSFGRSLLAAITIAIFTRREGFGINRISAITSLLYAALIILFVLATKLTTAANAIFLQYTAPVYVLILEPIFYKEKFRARDFVTVALCMAGMSLFFVGKLRPEDVIGNVLALASGLCFALYFLLMRHPKAREVNRASAAIYGNLAAAAICAPFFVGVIGRDITATDLACIAYLGIVQIGVAYLLFTSAMMQGVRSLDAGIICYIEPVLNPVWVFLFLGERPSGWAIIGGAIIIASVLAHTLIEAQTKRTQAALQRE